MSTRQDGAPSPTVRSRAELVDWIAAGCKPAEQWRIGTEHEKIVFHTDDLGPVPYEGPRGIRAILEALVARYGWLPIIEGENIIALKRPDGEPAATVSLEPGGQFELSGAPLATLHEVAAETQQHLDQVSAIGKDLGVGFLGLGFSPTWTRAETPRMPKRRYAVMTRYMPTVGKGGLDMMYRTATIQVNLDFGSEADMVKKLRVSLALQPIATAIFAASPFTEGKPNGFLSMRSEVWRDTDKRRTGMLPFVFEKGMSFERYAEYALDVPMYFVYRDGQYIDVAGASFRDFMDGKLCRTSRRAANHRRLVRPHDDALSRSAHEALPRNARRRWRALAAHLRAAGLSGSDFFTTRRRSMRPGRWSRTGRLRSVRLCAMACRALRSRRLSATARHWRSLARPIAIARAGLAARARKNAGGVDEREYLAPVEEIVASGRTIAEQLLESYQRPVEG
jgi:glutamate--cysteine ligase